MKYVDTDVFLYWALDHPDHGDAATNLLRHIELNEKAVTSALSLYLMDGVLQELGLEDYELGQLLTALEKLRNLKVEPLTEKLLFEAARVRGDLDVPLDVAVGVAVARDRKADAVYSNNAAYEKGPLPRRFGTT